MTNKKRRIGAICILIFTFLLIFFILYQKEMKSRNPITATAFKLNTVVTVNRLYDSQDTSLLDEALALCDYYEEIFSRTKETSELYRLNHGTLSKGSDGFLISSELEELIRSWSILRRAFSKAPSISLSNPCPPSGILPLERRLSLRKQPFRLPCLWSTIRTFS